MRVMSEPSMQASISRLNPFYRDRRIASFASFCQNELLPFWKAEPVRTFIGADGLEICYKQFNHTHAQQAIVILPGAAEFLDKYSELVYDFFAAGFDVYIMDHRGQGHSQRIVDGKNRLDVVSFLHYLDDVHHFLTHIVQQPWQQRSLLGHSMGGLIACCYHLDYGKIARRLILSAPAVYGEPPKRKLLDVGVGLLRVTRQDQRLIPLSRRAQPIYSFEESGSKCVARYQFVVDCLNKQPDLITNGASFRWLQALSKAQVYLASKAEEIKTPILLFQGGNDRWVSTAGHNSFISRVKDGQKVFLPDSYHDIYIERNTIRNEFLDKSLGFLQES